VAVTRLEPTHAGHSSPHFLPDYRHFLYYERGAPEVSGIYVGQLDDMASRPRLLAADSGAVYASGHLLFLRRGTLTAHAFDADRLELAGKPFPVAEQVAMGIVVSPALAVSATGLIAYRTGPSTDLRQFVWVDREGTVMQTVGEAGGGHLGPSLAGDGLQLAFFKPGANVGVMVMDLERGVSQRFTTHPADDVWPVYAPDQSIVFSSTRNNGLDLFRKTTVGAGRAEPLLIDRTNQLTVANDVWGDLLLYSRFANGIQSLWVRKLDGDAEDFQVVQTDSDAGSGQFSPDGKWIAYASKELGHWEIYIQAFPGSGPKRTVSTGGGIMPRWRDNGEELFYIALDDHLTAVRIRLPAHRQPVGEIEIAAPEPLFLTRVGRALEQTDLNPQYVVAPGGQRFLMNTLVEPANPSPIIVIRDWEPKR
jgi:hypothetical protein